MFVAERLILHNMLFVFIIVEHCLWRCTIEGVFLQVSPDSLGRHLWWGFYLNKVLSWDSGAGVFPYISWIFGSTCLTEHKRLFFYCFWSTVIINISSCTYRTMGNQVYYLTCFYFYYLLLLVLNIFALKAKKNVFPSFAENILWSKFSVSKYL